MKYLIAIFFILTVSSCGNGKYYYLKTPAISTPATGTDFYKSVASLKWKERDSLAINEILGGNIPPFFKKFIPVSSQIKDSNGIVHKAVFYVSPDYLSIGTA
jgi:hypothetical protein